MSGYSVAVIGAGAAGLGAVRSLTKAPNIQNVTVYEARDRIGGKIAWSDKLGFNLDLGPNWVHGISSSNPLADFIDLEKIDYAFDGQESSVIIMPDGRILPTSNNMENHFWQVIEDAIQYSKKNSDKIPFNKSLLDFINLEAPKYGIDEKSLAQAMCGWNGYIGEDISQQSLKYMYMEEFGPGEHGFVEGGYKQILDTIISVSGISSTTTNLHLQSQVTKICRKQGPNGKIVVDIFAREGNKEIINTFDAVIVAVPLGVLKNPNAIKFEPSLPPICQEAIKKLGFGRLEKVYIEFNEAFWINSNTNYKPDNFIFWGPKLQEKEKFQNRYPIFVMSLNFMDPKYRKNVLLFYIHGEFSDKITNLKGDNEAILNLLYPYYSQIPQFNSKIHYPLRGNDSVVATEWRQDPFAGFGSYVYFPKGIDHLPQYLNGLKIGAPPIYLAGEYVAENLCVATVGGALQSGQRAGNQVMKDLD